MTPGVDLESDVGLLWPPWANSGSGDGAAGSGCGWRRWHLLLNPLELDAVGNRGSDAIFASSARSAAGSNGAAWRRSRAIESRSRPD